MLSPGSFVDGRYEVGPLVGRGGMADVFRGDDVVTGDAVAVKVLRLDDDESQARFRHETEVLRRLDHPGVVRLRDAGHHEHCPYLVLDLVEGPNLARVLAGGPLGLDRSLAVGERLAAALAHAHGLDVVHRDVKPSNVLFPADTPDRPRLADFGIAHLADATRLTAAGGCVGTPAYIAPEQLEGATGPAADVWSLGLLVIECITGALCYPGTVAEAAVARLHRAPVVPAALPGWLRHTLQAMTDREPERRPSADQVTRALAERSVAPLLQPTQPVRLSLAARTLPTVRTDAAAALGTVATGAGSRRSPVPGGVLTAAAVLVVAVAAAVGWVGGGPAGEAGSPTTTSPATAATAAPSTTAPAASPSSTVVPVVEAPAASSAGTTDPSGPGTVEPPAPAVPGPGPAADRPGPAARGPARPAPGHDDGPGHRGRGHAHGNDEAPTGPAADDG
ncbi:MAG TPA: serine/threonine-protein kinase [Acidimicrobiales bacterium]